MPNDLSAEAVTNAAANLAGVVRRTPLELSERLSDRAGAPVLLKREDQQLCRSYKVRGAFHTISSLDPSERARGVVCASAGNHGQGVAFSCQRLGIKGTVVVPSTTPRQKRQRIEALGAGWVELVTAGSSYDEADAAAREDAARTGAVYVHPFDDPRTITGQGTVAIELVEQADAGLGTVVTLVLRALRIKAGNPFLEVLFGGTYLSPFVTPVNFLSALLAMLLVGYLAHLYPVSVALRIQPVRAMQQE